MKGVLIKDGWWKVAEPVDLEEAARLIGADRIEVPALKMGTHYYGCVCDAEGRSKAPEGTPETVVMRIRKGLMRRWRFYGYITGPVFIFLNKGLEDTDVECIRRRIFLNDSDDPFVVVDDFRDMAYEPTDP